MTVQNKSKTKIITCDRCGDKFEAAPSRRRKLCYNCANDNMIASWQQIHAQSGPIYDKWVAGMKRHWESQRKEFDDNST